jgi:hypothetical protein
MSRYRKDRSRKLPNEPRGLRKTTSWELLPVCLTNVLLTAVLVMVCAMNNEVATGESICLLFVSDIQILRGLVERPRVVSLFDKT